MHGNGVTENGVFGRDIQGVTVQICPFDSGIWFENELGGLAVLQWRLT